MALPPIQPTTPLDWRTKIVNPDGTPNNYFIRLWQTVYGNGSNVNADIAALKAAALQAGSGISITPDGHLLSNPTIAAEVQAILDQISTTQGTVLFRGSADWQALAPGTSGDFLQTSGAGADPVWAAAGGGGGGYTLIDSQTLAAAAASVTFSSIPAGYTDLVLVSEARQDAGGGVALNIQFNGDTGANYAGLYWNRFGTSNFTNFIRAGTSGDSAITAGVYAVSQCEILAYTDARFKNIMSRDGDNTTGGTPAIIDGVWRSTAAITSIVAAGTGNMAAGSQFRLYGRGGTSTVFGTPFETTAVGTGASQGITLPATGLTTAAVNVYCNGLRFPTAEYSITGTTLTMTSNAAGDDIAITGYMP